jgi:hypothetical protein
MAEMDTSGGGGHKKGPGVKKGKKLSTRIDVAPDLKITGFKAKDGIRDVIIKKKKMVDGLKRSGALGPKDETTVLIKPDVNSTYSDLVNMLDEMSINDVKVYAIIDISDVEKGFIQATEAASAGQ